MILTTVIERLRAEAMPTLKSIAGAEELEALSRGTPAAHGACFVVPFAEQAEPSNIIGGVRQRVEVTFLVACVIRRHDDPQGARRVEAADAFGAAIEKALAGWCWDADDGIPTELVMVRAAPGLNNVTLYVQTWRTERWIFA